MGVAGQTLLNEVDLARSFATFMEDGPTSVGHASDDLLRFFGGDDGIFNLCQHLDRASPDEDIRPYAAMWVEGWIADGEASWSDPWSADAVGIAKEAAAVLLGTMRDRAVMPADFLVYFDNLDHSWARSEAAKAVPRPA